MSVRYVWGRYSIDTSYSYRWRWYANGDDDVRDLIYVGSGNWYTYKSISFNSSNGSVSGSSPSKTTANTFSSTSALTYPILGRSQSNSGSGYKNFYRVNMFADYSDALWYRMAYSGSEYYAYVGQIYVEDYDRLYVDEERSQGSFNAWVSSPSASSYPNYDISGSYFYESETQDNLDPVSVSIPSTILPNQEIQITVSPSSDAQNNTYGTISYLYEYCVDDGSWTTINTTNSTSANFTVPATALTIQVRVRAQDNIGFTSNDYVTSSKVNIVSDGLLNISGEDGDIGTVVNDISFTVTSDVLSEAEVTVTIGSYVESFTATIGQEYFINIFDVLIAQGGSIVIVATGNYNGTQLNKTRSLIYTKSGQSFPSDNASITMLGTAQNPQYPLSVSEAIRCQGDVTLDVFLANLQASMQSVLSQVEAINERTLYKKVVIQNLEDTGGSKTFTQDIGFTGASGAVLKLLIDFTFNGNHNDPSEAPTNNMLLVVGTNPSQWVTTSNIHMYITGENNDHLLMTFFSNSQQEVDFGKTFIGHHKLVMKVTCSDSNVCDVWFDGEKIVSGQGTSFPTGAWSISNAEGSNRFYGTYHMIAILNDSLTDEELLNTSKLDYVDTKLLSIESRLNQLEISDALS